MILPRDVLHHFSNIFVFLLQDDRTGIQPGDFEQILHQRFDAVQLLFGQVCKLFDLRRRNSFVLKQTVVDIQRRQRCFELVRNICNGIFQKTLLTLLVVCVCAQNCRQCINGVKQTVKFSLPVAVQSCIRVAIQTALNLLDCLFQKRALPLEIAKKHAPEAAAQQKKNQQ